MFFVFISCSPAVAVRSVNRERAWTKLSRSSCKKRWTCNLSHETRHYKTYYRVCVFKKKNAQVLRFMVLNDHSYTKLLTWKKEINQLFEKIGFKTPTSGRQFEADPLAIYKRDREVELGLTKKAPSPLQTGWIWKRRLSILKWTESILEMEIYENNGVTIIVWFPCPSFSQPQIQNNWWLFHFQIPWA